MSKFLISFVSNNKNTEISILDLSDNSVAIFDDEEILDLSQNQKISSLLSEVLEALEMSSTDILGMVCGVRDIEKDEVLEIFKEKSLPLDKIIIISDLELLMYSLSRAPGILMHASNISKAIGFDDSREIVNCGGHGSLFSNLGSSYWIATQILREYIKHTDDQVPFLPIYDEIEAEYELKRGELLKKLPNFTEDEIIKASNVVIASAENGDMLCRNIIEAACFNLANIAATVYRKLHTSTQMSIDVVMTGELFSNEIIKNLFSDHLVNQTNYKNFNFIIVESSTSEVGLELCKKMYVKN